MSDLVQSIWAHNHRKIVKGMIMRFGNASPRNSRKATECLEQFRARGVRHPPYSLNLAPSDFFVFGCVKSKLPGLAIRSRDDFICEIRPIFEDIPKVILIYTHASWITRIKWRRKNGGTIPIDKQKTVSSYLEVNKKIQGKTCVTPRFNFHTNLSCQLPSPMK
jgi:hypothetical protein